MAWIVGIDEAGYGPNLGPLCVAATAWEIALAPSARTNEPSADLYSRLSEVVTRTPDGTRMAIGDSKTLYKSRGGLQELERGVLAGAIGGLTPTARWCDLLRVTGADEQQHRRELPWHEKFDCALPLDASGAELTELAARFSAGCEAAGVRLLAVRARMVFPAEFNRLTEQYGSKGATLSHVSIGLLETILSPPPLQGGVRGGSELPGDSTPLLTSPLGGEGLNMAPCSVTFDKHGGRNRYAELLQHHFPNQNIKTIHESRPASRYAWGPAEARTEVCFRTGGEAELPVALASMTAKYLRELAMRAFNRFWCAEVPGLRPTAGYPVDAKRFKAEIASKQKQLGIEDCDLWRNR